MTIEHGLPPPRTRRWRRGGSFASFRRLGHKCAQLAPCVFSCAPRQSGPQPHAGLQRHPSNARLNCRLPDYPWVPWACLAVERQLHRALLPLRPAFGAFRAVDSACSQWPPTWTERGRWQRGSATNHRRYRARVRSCIGRAARTQTGPTLWQCGIQWQTAVALTPQLLCLRARVLLQSGRAQRRLQIYHWCGGTNMRM
jgi:hypothetical protein